MLRESIFDGHLLRPTEAYNPNVHLSLAHLRVSQAKACYLAHLLRRGARRARYGGVGRRQRRAADGAHAAHHPRRRVYK